MLYNMNKSVILIITVVIVLAIIYINHEYDLKKIEYFVTKARSKYEESKPQREILGFLRYNSKLKSTFNSLLERKASAMDPDLISFVREVIDHPAPPNQIKMSRNLMLTPQAKEIDALLAKKTKGFFIEAGGLDGERSSNTIWLEKERGWTGLLVEPDPYFYTQLIGKNRNAWSINGCISPYNYVSEISFKQSTGGKGQLDLETDNTHFKVPCYPLLTLLKAISISHVDFFSLDVEGAEGIILESLPLDILNISTFAVEYLHGDKKKYLEIMERKGYSLVKDIHVFKPEITLFVDDFIFAKKGLNIKVLN